MTIHYLVALTHADLELVQSSLLHELHDCQTLIVEAEDSDTDPADDYIRERCLYELLLVLQRAKGN